jgi:iron complex outermembrane receptor protein
MPLKRTRFRGIVSRFNGLMLLWTLFQGAIVYGQQGRDLDQMSPEELSKLEVTSVSKKEQKLSDTAAAIFVITQQDIRNSTATNIPELLRLVPGLDVAQISGGNWAISARGFTELYARDMLVLVDGRSVFDAAFSGVVWSEQNLMLEDIDRIEVIRGPGSVVWGTNAVNGVINIITKHSKDTQGGLISAGSGDPNHNYDAVRYGGQLGKSTSYRLSTQYFEDGPSGTYLGRPAHDSAHSLDGGMRVDSKLTDRDALLVEGKIFNGSLGTDTTGFSYAAPYITPAVGFVDTQGGYVLTRLTHHSLAGSETSLQLSYQHTNEGQLGLSLNGNVGSASLQHERAWGTRQDLVMGVEYDFRAAESTAYLPIDWFNSPNPSFYIASGFIQDEILFLNGNLRFTVGGRVEDNRYNGLAFQPNARVLWKITPAHSLWVAYSLADRGVSPSDVDVSANRGAFLTSRGLVVVRGEGNRNLSPEKLAAVDAGYRSQLGKTLFFDAAVFFYDYKDLINAEPGQPFFEPGPPPRIVQPMIQRNNGLGRSLGGELSVKWNPNRVLNFGVAYSLLNLDLDTSTPAAAATASIVEGEALRHQAALTSSINLPHKFELSSLLAVVDRRITGPVPGYARLDSSLVWRPGHGSEFRIGANNLLNREHIEFVSTQGANSTLLKRSVYGRASWYFGGK